MGQTVSEYFEKPKPNENNNDPIPKESVCDSMSVSITNAKSEGRNSIISESIELYPAPKHLDVAKAHVNVSALNLQRNSTDFSMSIPQAAPKADKKPNKNNKKSRLNPFNRQSDSSELKGSSKMVQPIEPEQVAAEEDIKKVIQQGVHFKLSAADRAEMIEKPKKPQSQLSMTINSALKQIPLISRQSTDFSISSSSIDDTYVSKTTTTKKNKKFGMRGGHQNARMNLLRQSSSFEKMRDREKEQPKEPPKDTHIDNFFDPETDIAKSRRVSEATDNQMAKIQRILDECREIGIDIDKDEDDAVKMIEKMQFSLKARVENRQNMVYRRRDATLDL